jgi:DNA (cytosine-5)-methyltransferase 1
LLPTPTVSDNRGAARGEVEKGNPKHRLKVEVELLPTTRVSMANGPTRKEIAEGNPKSRLEVEVVLEKTNWARFEPAIKRWESVIGRPAPAPTKPDGNQGREQISSLFTEWLMGLPDGWITGHGLSRNDELKLAGNGVVPQQAELALKLLLERAK